MFCDAMAIIHGLDFFFRSFIVSSIKNNENANAIRLTSNILALICVILQELPENSKLIENIIFNENVDLCKFFQHKNSKVRLRACMMLRLLGRFCCFALQNHWTIELSNVINKELTKDSDEEVRNVVKSTIEEFQMFQFFREKKDI
jgi:hypothetical protein